MPSCLTPDRALEKVLRISRLNGWSVVVLAGCCTLVTVLIGDWTGILVGLLVVASGLMEVRGNRMLRRRNAAGVSWLIRAQVFLLGVILVYASVRIVGFDREFAAQNFSPLMRTALEQLELSLEDLLLLVRLAVRGFYGAVMLGACLYQGGLALYYRKRQALVELALAAPPAIASGT